jgi:hypothetical protein
VGLPGLADTFATEHTSAQEVIRCTDQRAVSSPAAEPAYPVSRAQITTSIDSLTNRLREQSQFNFQATYAAIKADPLQIETGL